MAKMIRIIRVVTTVTDVDLNSYFDFVPGIDGLKRPWTAEEAIAYEQGRGQMDKHEAFEVAMQNGEMTGFVQAFDVITVDERTADEKTADEQGATYLTPSRDATTNLEDQLTVEEKATVARIRAGVRPAGLSDAEWEWVKEHPVESALGTRPVLRTEPE